MKKLTKLLILFLFGGASYIIIEILYRGYSHFSMFILGGILFLEIGILNELCDNKTSLLLQGIIGSFLITVSELITGLILNVWLNLNIWDYSDLPFNILGQISLPYSIIWIFISIVAVILDDILRHRLFGEIRPYYKLF